MPNVYDFFQMGAELGRGAVQAAAIRQQGVSQERAGRLQQFLFEREAKNVRAASKREATRIKKLKQKTSGRQRAVAAASGIQLEGSAMDVFQQSLFDAEAAALEELFRGEEASFGLRSKGAFARYEGRQAKRQATLAGVGVALSSIAKAASAGSGTTGTTGTTKTSGTK